MMARNAHDSVHNRRNEISVFSYSVARLYFDLIRVTERLFAPPRHFE